MALAVTAYALASPHDLSHLSAVRSHPAVVAQLACGVELEGWTGCYTLLYSSAAPCGV